MPPVFAKLPRNRVEVRGVPSLASGESWEHRQISGQGCWDSEGNVAPSTAKQVELALGNVEKALKTADSGLS